MSVMEVALWNKAAKRIGRKLGQRAMYFEVSGYDGVQILRITGPDH